jgi:hypothetical protein
MATFPPTDSRANLGDSLSYIKTLGGDAARLAAALHIHHRNPAHDHQTRGALSRLRTTLEDFAHTIDHALANLSTSVRATIERSPT